ncbi:MAG TPA: VIT1/CCC1 transporter family protein [Steroidobacteraceae bacterium]|jgi:VIT1/CCC1 family predicted Fe2+/Mn2+ transporter|nr:VIT1/CCC1 transporter family protein [Steroidobacteraceae bacterium]
MKEVVDSWYHEKESAWLYRQVAAAEPDPNKQRLFTQLAAAAEDQAAKWEISPRNTAAAPRADRLFMPSLRARVVARLLRLLGPRAVRSVLAAMKLRGLSIYTAPVASGHAMPTTLSDVGVRHRGGLGGNLRATVFGVNDGLVSNASLVLGVAGASAPSSFVLIGGVAGLLAGALSMAAGEYVSVRSQREMYEYQIALEREEIAEYPEEEAEELALIYEARGVTLAQAREVSQALLARPEQALDVLSREELGLNPDDLGSPFGAATASFLSFAAGAAVPLIPFLVDMRGSRALAATAVLTALALFAVGLALSLFTGRHAVRGALRMVLIGGGAGAVAFFVGRALGTIIH